MIKILHISANQFPPLDKMHPTKKIWEELALSFEEYHIIARAENNRFNYSRDKNIHLHLVPKLGNRNRSFLISGLYLFILVIRYRINGLLLQSAIFGGIYALIVNKLFNIPYMVEIHGEEYFRILNKDKFWYLPLSKILLLVYKNANKIRSLNSRMTAKLARFDLKENVVEIPNRVDLDLFKEKKTDFTMGDTIQLVSVGSFVPAKNYNNLIRILCQSDLKFRLTLIGGGKLKKSYYETLEKFGNVDQLMLIDRVGQQELAHKMIQADIYIQYSVSEGMPRSILEAMALQIPIISTDVGSIAGVLTNKVNGILIDLNNEPELINSIKYLSNDLSLRKSLSETARQNVEDNYKWEAVFHKYRFELAEMCHENS